MTTTVLFLVEEAAGQLHDVDCVRWTGRDHVRALSLAQRELIRLRPDQLCQTVSVNLVPGFRQALPADADAFIDVPNNSSGRARRITRVDEAQLDAIRPDWRSATNAREIEHFVHDMRRPREFLVYPPADSGAAVDLTHSLMPPELALPPAGIGMGGISGALSVPDVWVEALVNFMLFKAYSRDAEFGGNAGMAASHLALFNAATASQLQSSAQVATQS